MPTHFTHIVQDYPKQRSLHKGNVAWFWWISLCLLLWATWYALSPIDQKYLPTSENIILLIISFMTSRAIKNNYARWIFTAWNIWPLIGFVSLTAINFARIGLNYNVDSELANQYYLLCTLLCEIGALIYQKLSGKYSIYDGFDKKTTPILIIFLAVSPILFIIAVVRGVGGIPILSGTNVSELMYEEDYGFFYRFAIYLSVAAIFFWIYFNNSRFKNNAMTKYLTILFIVFVLVSSMVSGKRAFAMYAVFGIILFNLSRSISMKKLIQTALAGLLGILSYLFIASIRSGQGIERAVSNWYIPFASVGTEYRDYVYTFSVFSRASVLSTGYDWLGSTLSGLFPSFILSLLGIDKDSVSQLDSARSLAKMFHIDLGIRIGLPGEIWFAYGWWGVLLFIPFGILIGWASRRTEGSRNSINMAIWLTVLSLFGLSILNQSTVTFGALLTLLYLGILSELLGSHRHSISAKGDLPAERAVR